MVSIQKSKIQGRVPINLIGTAVDKKEESAPVLEKMYRIKETDIFTSAKQSSFLTTPISDTHITDIIIKRSLLSPLKDSKSPQIKKAPVDQKLLKIRKNLVIVHNKGRFIQKFKMTQKPEEYFPNNHEKRLEYVRSQNYSKYMKQFGSLRNQS